jgi:hypothetical protein
MKHSDASAVKPQRLRRAINRRPTVVMALCLLMIIAAVCVAFTLYRARAPVENQARGPRWWYTTDNGVSFFADEPGRLIAFQHEGKTAYRCYVWTCDGGKTRFVSHVERLKPQAIRLFAGKSRIDPLEVPPGMQEVRPARSEGEWFDSGSPEAALATTPRCPDGKGDAPRPVIAE